MVQAQGLRPPTPHQVLQLDPAAPRSLVVEAYLTLSRRAARLGEAAWLRDLRTAYAAVMHPVERPDDPSEGDRRSYYAVLRVDAHADTEIVELAFSMLPRLEPAPHRSDVRYLREEAHRVLCNPQLRARYDDEVRNATLVATPRPIRPVPTGRPGPSQENSPVERKKRGLFGRGQSFDLDAARDARLLSLRDQLSVPSEQSPEPPAEEAAPANATPQAEVVFLAGPRDGMRVEVDGNVIPLGEGKSTGALWRHGGRFLLRHSGKGVKVGGAVPTLAILVLEDGDEIAIGSDRARFQVLSLPPSP